MKQFDKVSVVVGGVRNLEATAQLIKEHIENAGGDIPVLTWSTDLKLPNKKPYIVIISEAQLLEHDIPDLNIDIVVIKELSDNSEQIENAYLKLYQQAGPHMTTVLNADDRSVVKLAAREVIRKGRTFYFSKNKGLKPQIKNIGGLVSSGETIEIYGFNFKPEPVTLKISKILSYDQEISLLSSLVAVMEFGFDPQTLRC